VVRKTECRKTLLERDANLDLPILDSHRICRNIFNSRQSCNLTGPYIKASSMPGANNFMIDHLAITERATVMRAYITNCVVIPPDIKYNQMKLIDIYKNPVSVDNFFGCGDWDKLELAFV